jgi:drug/metabolite transporter (DMT)-like permease
MVLVTLLWSTAGVITRHLDAARSFEVTFWRSAFNALALVAALGVMRGRLLWRTLRHAPWPMWASALCWAVMFTAFMVAITLTTVANVLVTMALGPLITALFSRLFLRHPLPLRTWCAMGAAGAGIVWMFGREAQQGASLLGTVVAMAVPLAAAANWTLLQYASRSTLADPRTGHDEPEGAPDMLPAVMLGAILSALLTLPLALPLQATPHDLGWLAALGVFQLALPCLLVVRLSQALPAPEIALLGLLEVLFGVAWAWLGAGEKPPGSALLGGSLVLGALLVNEALALRERQQAA